MLGYMVLYKPQKVSSYTSQMGQPRVSGMNWLSFFYVSVSHL